MWNCAVNGEELTSTQFHDLARQMKSHAAVEHLQGHPMIGVVLTHPCTRLYSDQNGTKIRVLEERFSAVAIVRPASVLLEKVRLRDEIELH